MHDWRLSNSEQFLNFDLLDRVEQRSVMDVWLVRFSDGRKARLYLFSPKATMQLAPFSGDPVSRTAPHARIMGLLAAGTVPRPGGDCSYLVLDWIDGRRLSKIIADGPTWSRKDVQDKVMALALDVAEIFSQLEADEANRAGWVPGHLNPDTIWLDRDGRPLLEHPLLAQALSELQSLRLNSSAGYLGYMSPEQVGGRALDMRSDLFSFAVVLYELLSGKRLFSGGVRSEIVAQVKQAAVPPLAQVCPWVEERIADAIVCALARDVDARPKGWAAWLDVLVLASGGQPLARLPVSQETEILRDEFPRLEAASEAPGEERPPAGDPSAPRASSGHPLKEGLEGSALGVQATLDRTLDAAIHPDMITRATGVAEPVFEENVVHTRFGWWHHWGWEIGLVLALVSALGFFLSGLFHGAGAETVRDRVSVMRSPSGTGSGWRVVRRREGAGGMDLLFVGGGAGAVGPSLITAAGCMAPRFWVRDSGTGWLAVFVVPREEKELHLGRCAR